MIPQKLLEELKQVKTENAELRKDLAAAHRGYLDQIAQLRQEVERLENLRKASAARAEYPGLLFPVSQSPTFPGETPTAFASWPCVIPFLVLSSFKSSLNIHKIPPRNRE